jgi:hypothetical protein
MRARGVVTVVAGQDVGLAPMTDTQVRGLASGLVIETTIPLLAGVMCVVDTVWYRGEAQVLAEQIRAARALLASPYRERAIDYLEAGRRGVVFTAEQLLLAMRLVIEYGRPGASSRVDPLRVTQLVLSVTDIMGRDELETGAPEDLAVALTLRRLGLPRAEQPLHELARWYDLLVTRARAAVGAPGTMDLDALFRARTGLAIEDFLGIAWMHAAPVLTAGRPAELGHVGHRMMLAHPERHYRDPDIAAAAAALLIGDLPAMRKRFERDAADLHRSSLRPFWEYPYIRLDSGRIVAVSSTFALNRGVRGIYHLLIDEQSRARGSTGINELTSFVGRLHEEYLANLLRRALASCRHGVFVSEAEVIAASGRDDRPPFDAAIVAGDTVVLIEMLTATMRLRTLESGYPALYQRDFDTYFKKKAEQLARAVEGVGNGTWTIPRLSPGSVRRVLPVLVSLHPFPLFGPMWNPFTSTFGQPVFGHEAQVMPLQLITDEDLEVLEAGQGAGSLSIVDALTRRTEKPAWIESRMTNVLMRAWKHTAPDNPAMRDLYTIATTALRDAAVRTFNVA